MRKNYSTVLSQTLLLSMLSLNSCQLSSSSLLSPKQGLEPIKTESQSSQAQTDLNRYRSTKITIKFSKNKDLKNIDSGFNTKYLPDTTENILIQVKRAPNILGRKVKNSKGQDIADLNITVTEAMRQAGQITQSINDLPAGTTIYLLIEAKQGSKIVARATKELKLKINNALNQIPEQASIVLGQVLEERDTGDGEGTITGTVIDTQTQEPIAAATVLIPAENSLDRDMVTYTNSTGQFNLKQVRPGRKVIVISKQGKKTEIEVSIIKDESKDLGKVSLDLYQGPEIKDMPIIQLSQPTDPNNNSVTGLSPVFDISGSVQNLDASEIIVITNGAQDKVAVSSTNNFSHKVILTEPGDNEIILRAANALGITEKRIKVNYKEAEIGVHVKLSWDTNYSDIDLHVLDPLGKHTYYSQKYGIPNSQLDVDDVNGYGPENFTMSNLPVSVPGRYKVGVRYFNPHGLFPVTSKCFVEITLNAGTPQRQHQDYESLLNSAFESGVFPISNSSSTWRVADIIVNADGSTQIVEPNSEITNIP